MPTVNSEGDNPLKKIPPLYRYRRGGNLIFNAGMNNYAGSNFLFNFTDFSVLQGKLILSLYGLVSFSPPQRFVFLFNEFSLFPSGFFLVNHIMSCELKKMKKISF